MKSNKHKNKRQPKTVNDYPKELRGLSNNGWGGHKSLHLRGYAGGSYGAVDEGHTFTAEEREQYARENGYL